MEGEDEETTASATSDPKQRLMDIDTVLTSGKESNPIKVFTLLLSDLYGIGFNCVRVFFVRRVDHVPAV